MKHKSNQSTAEDHGMISGITKVSKIMMGHDTTVHSQVMTDEEVQLFKKEVTQGCTTSSKVMVSSTDAGGHRWRKLDLECGTDVNTHSPGGAKAAASNCL